MPLTTVSIASFPMVDAEHRLNQVSVINASQRICPGDIAGVLLALRLWNDRRGLPSVAASVAKCASVGTEDLSEDKISPRQAPRALLFWNGLVSHPRTIRPRRVFGWSRECSSTVNSLIRHPVSGMANLDCRAAGTSL